MDDKTTSEEGRQQGGVQGRVRSRGDDGHQGVGLRLDGGHARDGFDCAGHPESGQQRIKQISEVSRLAGRQVAQVAHGKSPRGARRELARMKHGCRHKAGDSNGKSGDKRDPHGREI